MPKNHFFTPQKPFSEPQKTILQKALFTAKSARPFVDDSHCRQLRFIVDVVENSVLVICRSLVIDAERASITSYKLRHEGHDVSYRHRRDDRRYESADLFGNDRCDERMDDG